MSLLATPPCTKLWFSSIYIIVLCGPNLHLNLRLPKCGYQRVNDHSPLQRALTSPFLVMKKEQQHELLYSSIGSGCSYKSRSGKQPFSPSESVNFAIFEQEKKTTLESHVQVFSTNFSLIVKWWQQHQNS